jgi:hypothetical protein
VQANGQMNDEGINVNNNNEMIDNNGDIEVNEE